MRILFLTSRLPFPPVGGDRLRTFNMVKHLSGDHQVTLVSFIERDEELTVAADFRACYTELVTVKLPRRQSYLNSVRGLFSRLPLQVHYYWSPRMQAVVNRELSRGYDAVFCHLIRMAPYIINRLDIHKVIDFTDAISLNYERSRALQRGFRGVLNSIEARRVRDYEFYAIDRADAAIFISEVDATSLTRDANKNKIKVVANGVDVEKFGGNPVDYDENKIAFLGNMRTFPNTDAVLYFVREILPLLKEKRPGLKFYIIGNEPNRAVRHLHDGRTVFVTGFVESVVAHLRDCAVMVAPMRAGAGVQNKILEALAAGVPVVTTAIGAEGLDAGHLEVANNADQFVEKTLALLENKPWRKSRALNGRRYVEETFSWSRQLKDLDNCLRNGRAATVQTEAEYP